MQDELIKFKCERCEQEYFIDSFNIAVFLYGIFFLIGNESGYAGITCPSCLKTITHEMEIDRIKLIRKNLSSLIIFDHYQFPLNLRYHSSINYFPKTIQKFKKIPIRYWNTLLPTDLHILHNSLNQYICDLNLNDNFFCTYAFDDESPMGGHFSAAWLMKDWIDEFIKIENNISIKIFPRYMPQNTLINDIDRFCWNNHVYLEYLKDKFHGVESNIDELKEWAKQNNKNFQEILDANPGIQTSSVVEFEKKQSVEYLEKERHKISTDFLSILASDPFPEEDPLKELWITINPFLDKQVPKTLDNFDFTQYEKSQKGPSHDEKATLVKENFNKNFVQDFLYEHHIDFIKEYIELSGKIDFSLAAIWMLKENYLTRLYDHTRLGVLSEKRYSFYNEGPGWRIIFDGTPISPLTTRGFNYIHYLVSNKYNVYTIDELADLDGIETETKHRSLRSDPEISVSKPTKAAILDDQYIRELEDRIKDLHIDINEAVRSADPLLIKEANDKLEKDLEYYKKNVKKFGKTKKSRSFSDNSTKNQRRIAKNIERCLNEIKKWNKDVYRHFHDALSPIDSYYQSYQPLQDIDWHTE